MLATSSLKSRGFWILSLAPTNDKSPYNIICREKNIESDTGNYQRLRKLFVRI